ncbi:hypothetical protein DICPUDRAFT_93057, partial [Dictyostelium purpureum]
MNIFKLVLIIIFIIVNYNNGNIILALNDPSKEVDCGDISGSSNQFFSVFNLAKQITISTPFTSTIAGASISTPKTSSNINQSCEYYNSKNTVINAQKTTLGDQTKDIINSLSVQHYLLFNGSVTVSKGSNINISCNDLNNNECFKTNILDLSGKLLISNKLSNVNVQSDINISKTGILTTSSSSSLDSYPTQPKITSQNNINNNGGTIQVNQPLSITTKLLNINSNGIFNINAFSSINSPIDIKGSSQLNVNYESNIASDLNVYDNSIVKVQNIKLDNEKSSFNSNGANTISVTNFLSNGLLNINQSNVQVKSMFNMGSSSVVNILNNGGFFSNNNINISGSFNMENGFFSSYIGDFLLKDNSVFTTKSSNININSAFSSHGDSLFENNNCNNFAILSLDFKMNDNSKLKFGNCKEIQIESISSVLSNNAEFHILQKSKVMANSPFTLNDQSKLLINENSQH